MNHASVMMRSHAVEMLSFSKRVMTHAIMTMSHAQCPKMRGSSHMMLHSFSMVLNRIHCFPPFSQLLLWYGDSFGIAYALVDSEQK